MNVLLQVAEAVEAKARYCDRKRHRNPESYKIGMAYVSLCRDCANTMKGHMRAKAERLLSGEIPFIKVS